MKHTLNIIIGIAFSVWLIKLFWNPHLHTGLDGWKYLVIRDWYIRLWNENKL